jgi:hypothetical protein
MQESDIDHIKDLLNRLEIKELGLSHRLREIIELYSELISLNATAISLFSKDRT